MHETPGFRRGFTRGLMYASLTGLPIAAVVNFAGGHPGAGVWALALLAAGLWMKAHWPGGWNA